MLVCKLRLLVSPVLNTSIFLPVFYVIYIVGGKPSGRESEERRNSLEFLLKQGFEIKDGHEINSDTVLTYVDFDPTKKVRLTRAVKEAFPGVYTRRDNKGGHKQYPLFSYLTNF